MKEKEVNIIMGVFFERQKDRRHQIILVLKDKIPSLGYGVKEIIRMLKEYNKPKKNNL